jgi:hypothetical protein
MRRKEYVIKSFENCMELYIKTSDDGWRQRAISCLWFLGFSNDSKSALYRIVGKRIGGRLKGRLSIPDAETKDIGGD